MKLAPGVLILVVAASTSALAQEAPRGVVRGFGGVTFMSETATVFGAGVGIRLNDHVEVFGELGRLTNVLPHALQRDLDDAARAIGTYFGGPLSIDGRAPGVYGLGGVRVSRAAGRRLRVYAEAGAGTTHGTSDITAHAGTANVSREVVRALTIKDSETAPLFTAGGGVTVPIAAHFGLDVGYRFMRIFTDDPRINTANMSAGLRWGF
jgi:hypothetical protein